MFLPGVLKVLGAVPGALCVVILDLDLVLGLCFGFSSS